MLRRYWQPAALSEELPPGGAPLPVKLLGEDLVLFRDDEGRPGLLGLHCSHRGADLSYGRVEDGGLRCIYHGWLYDIRGNCLDQPGEPGGGEHKGAIRHPAYPCQERAEVIFAYMGPGETPLLPAYDLFAVPEDYRYQPAKSYHECSYLQANEGNLDPVHLSFLHRLWRDDSPEALESAGQGMRRTTAHELNLQDTAPSIDAELTDYGLRIYSVRRAGADQNYVRITNLVMPNLCAIGGGTGGDGYQMDWHVPIDDTRHWKYSMAFRRSSPLEDRRLKDRLRAITTGYRRVRNKSNRYLQDRGEMKTKSFTGLGTNFLDHDGWGVESPGAIQDRTAEHLVSTDKAIVAGRKILLQAIRDVEEGRDPLHVIRDPGRNRFPHLFVRHEVVPSSRDWKGYWKEGIGQ
jgi:phenylpropionate dioxygenase-like ring-hydroxylating dioxygenase large terminal subunit